MEIKNQLLEISKQLRALDERVESLEYSTVIDHTYRIGELEAMMNYDDPLIKMKIPLINLIPILKTMDGTTSTQKIPMTASPHLHLLIHITL